MPDNNLSPEEIKAIKELAKYHVVGGRMRRRLSPSCIVYVIVGAFIITAILFGIIMWLSSLDPSQFASYKLF